MKYMLKRIFIGVAIGTILFLIKGGNVFAATSSQTIDSSRYITSASAKFDVCQEEAENLVCINGFNKTFGIYANSPVVLYNNNDKIIALRELSLEIDFPSGYQPIIYKYANFSDLSFIFARNQDPSYANGFLNKSTLAANRFPIYIQLTTTDNTICEPTIFGSSIALSSNVQNVAYFEVPTNCQNKQLSKFVITYTPGVNYVGLNSAILSTNPSDISSMTVSDYLNQYRNNTYLLVWNKKNIRIPDNQGNYMNIRFNSSSYPSSWTRVQNTYTLEDQQIKQNLEELNKQIYLASLGGTDLGPNMPSAENQQEVNDGILGLSSQIGTSLSTASFQDFLSALVLKPIQELQWTIRNDNLTADGSAISCPAVTRLYFSYSRSINEDMNKWSMNLPCMSNVYENIPFVGPNGLFSLVNTWHIVLMGYLYYLLVLTWLNLVKYTVTRSNSEIEVIEL